MMTKNLWYKVENEDQIITPALFVYPDRIKKNIESMIRISGANQRLIPHVKTYKMQAVVKMQMEYGIKQFKCATLGELQMLISCGVDHILLAIQPTKEKMLRFLEAQVKHPKISFSTLVDNEASLDLFSELAFAQNQKINLIRPLLNFEKKDLTYISKFIFGFFVEDPSNEDDTFKRVKIRGFLKKLETEGLDKKKFLLTINNLKFSNETIKFYTKKNLLENTYFSEKKKLIILKESFFHHSAEVIFRSFTDVIKIVGKKYYPVRGKKIDSIIQLINNKSYFKVTLGGCVIKKVNQTIIVSKE